MSSSTQQPNSAGDVVQARQVSTQPEKMQEFFERLKREFLGEGGAFLAVVEVCGFNDWLLEALEQHQCHKVILIQPEERKRQKTDRRDAAALSELLWVNRDRFLVGKPVRGLRQVQLPSPTDQQNRRLITLRKEASEARTRVKQSIPPNSAVASAVLLNRCGEICTAFFERDSELQAVFELLTNM